MGMVESRDDTGARNHFGHCGWRRDISKGRSCGVGILFRVSVCVRYGTFEVNLSEKTPKITREFFY